MDGHLKVTIVGAGLAGLLAARVLREKHAVTLVEKFEGGHEVGAAINLGPNGVKIAQELGFDKARCRSIACGMARTMDRDGNVLMEESMGFLREQYGAEWLFQHRGDLWNEFLRLATCPSDTLKIQGWPAKMLWGTRVTGVDVQTGDVFLDNGGKLESDLVIGRLIFLHSIQCHQDTVLYPF
jgi:salicylate hydroxylase